MKLVRVMDRAEERAGLEDVGELFNPVVVAVSCQSCRGAGYQSSLGPAPLLILPTNFHKYSFMVIWPGNAPMMPMSLADACVVCMSEIHDRHAVLTLDSGFLVYRKHGRGSLPLIHPAAQ